MVWNLLYSGFCYSTIEFCPGLSRGACTVSSVRVLGAFHAESELQESEPNPAQLEPLAIWHWHAAYRRGRHYQLGSSLAAIRCLPDSAVGQVDDLSPMLIGCVKGGSSTLIRALLN